MIRHSVDAFRGFPPTSVCKQVFGKFAKDPHFPIVFVFYGVSAVGTKWETGKPSSPGSKPGALPLTDPRSCSRAALRESNPPVQPTMLRTVPEADALCQSAKGAQGGR